MAGLLVSAAAVGHPVAGPWPGLAVAVAVVHAAAMAVWLGGLAALLAAVLRPGLPSGELAVAVPRFSAIAFVAVTALVGSGILQSVREVGSPTALVSSSYGGILITKLVLVLVALASAGVSRVWVQQRLGAHRPRPGGRRRTPAHAFAAAPGPVAVVAGRESGQGTGPENPTIEDAADARGRALAEEAVVHVPALRRSVLAELAVAVGILALSAMLVGTPPARSALAQPVDVTLPMQGSAGAVGSVQVSVDPARPGPNTLHLYLFDDTGRLTQPAGIRASLTEEQQSIGPLDVELQPAGPGHYIGEGMSVPGAGTWALTVTARLDEFTATTATTTFPVR
jgi:copper transport protein